MSVNKVILIGNLGKDPEIRYIESNIKVAKLAIATNERYTSKAGTRVDVTEWHIVALWRGLADLAEKGLKKGSKVYIEGKLRTREYNDKEGNKRRVTEIEAENVVLLDRRPDDGIQQHQHQDAEKNTEGGSGENLSGTDHDYSGSNQDTETTSDDMPF